MSSMAFEVDFTWWYVYIYSILCIKSSLHFGEALFIDVPRNSICIHFGRKLHLIKISIDFKANTYDKNVSRIQTIPNGTKKIIEVYLFRNANFIKIGKNSIRHMLTSGLLYNTSCACTWPSKTRFSIKKSHHLSV